MRYNPATDNARYSIDEIAEQCRNAVLRAAARREEQEIYAQVLEFACWENDQLVAA